MLDSTANLLWSFMPVLVDKYIIGIYIFIKKIYINVNPKLLNGNVSQYP